MNKRYISIILILFCSLFSLFGQSPVEAPDSTTVDQKEEQNTEAQADAAEKKKTQEELEKEKKKQEHILDLDRQGADFIKRTLKYGTQKERAQSVKDFKRIRTDSIKKELLNVYLDNAKDETDSSVLIHSIRLFSSEDMKSAIPVIAKQLDSDNEDVQVAAIYALKDLKATSAKAKIIDQLKKTDFSENSTFTEGMLLTLAEFDESGLYEFVKEKIEDPDTTEFNKSRLILFLGNSKTIAAKGMLRDLFLDEDENITVRSYAVSSLSKLEDPTIAPDIKNQIKEIESYSVKKRAKYNTLYVHCITALVRMGDADAYDNLESSMKSNNATTRLRAIRLMAELKDKRSIDILRYKAQYDQNEKVRKEAEKILKDTFSISLEDEKKEKEEAEKKASETKPEKAPATETSEPVSE